MKKASSPFRLTSISTIVGLLFIFAATNLKADQTVTAAIGQSVTISVVASGSAPLTYQWTKNGANIAGATASSFVISNAQLGDFASYTAIVSNVYGSVSSEAAIINPSTVPPSLVASPSPETILSGANTTLSVGFNGNPSPSIQWFQNGVAITGATSSVLTLNNATTVNSGSYYAVATNSAGTAVSNSAALTVLIPSRFVNFSIRTLDAPSPQNLIIGFAVEGGSKSILIRAIGPGLVSVAPSLAGTVLANPQLYILSGATVVSSDNGWGGSTALANAFASVGAFPLPSNSLDSAIFATLPPNNYTALVPTTISGTVLTEAYDADMAEAPPGQLVNISGRAQVGTGSGVLILGFVIRGDTPMQLLIRAVGPELNTEFGIQGALSDPQLDLYQGTTLLQHNDDWGGGAVLSSAFSQVGAFSLTSSKDAAIITTLSAGSYTVVISGVNNSTGIALGEIYELP